MKRKTTVGSLIGLFFSLLILSAPPANAEAPKYDATGTWDHQVTNIWTNCPKPPYLDESNPSVVNQTGSSFTLNSSGKIDYGTVSGSRYQIIKSGSDSTGSGTNTVVWTLSSPTLGSGYITQTYVGGCSYTADIYIEKRTPFNCTPSDTVMCLQNGRFSVSVTWKNQQGQTGVGHSVPSTDDSGLFWFFSPNNMEMLIKVLNACGAPSKHYWVFFAATTDQEFTVTVTDLKNYEQVTYTNPLKNPADAVTDTAAFATCP